MRRVLLIVPHHVNAVKFEATCFQYPQSYRKQIATTQTDAVDIMSVEHYDSEDIIIFDSATPKGQNVRLNKRGGNFDLIAKPFGVRLFKIAGWDEDAVRTLLRQIITS